MPDIFNEIDKLHEEINSLRPLDNNLLKQIKEYYRIGLTYTSNALARLIHKFFFTIKLYMFISLCAQRNEPKKGARQKAYPPPVPRCNGNFETRFARTGRNSFP